MQRQTQLANDIWPLLLPRIQAMITAAASGSGGGSGAVNLAAHDLGGSLHKGTLRSDQAPQFLMLDGSRPLAGSLVVDAGVTIDGVDISAHAADINAHHAKLHAITDAAHHSATGSQYQIVGLTAVNTLGLLTPKSSPAANEIVKTDAGSMVTFVDVTVTSDLFVTGYLDFGTNTMYEDASYLQVAGSKAVRFGQNIGTPNWTVYSTGGAQFGGNVDIVSGGDLTVAGSGSYAGNTVLFADSSGGNVGIMMAPDPQFALDINGPARATYWIGPHAIQLKDVLLLAHYDGRAPYETNYSGEPNGHMGQAATVSGGLIFRPGKFGKAVQLAEYTVNLCTNPSFETNATGWSGYSSGTISRSGTQALYGAYSLAVTAGAANRGAQITVTGLTAFSGHTLSAWIYCDSAITIKLGGTDNIDKDHGDTTATIPAATWTRVTRTITTDAHTSVILRIYSTTAATFYVDGVQVENKNYATAYADGSLGGYNASGAWFASGNGHSWTGTAHASTTVRSEGRLLYQQSGNFGTLTGTLMCWVKFDATGISRTIFTGSTNGSLAVVAGTATVEVAQRNVGTVLSVAQTWTAETWYHVAVTWEGRVVKAYINGALVGTATAGADFVTPALLYVGRAADDTSTLDGLIDDLVILSHVSAAGEIKSVYESNAPVFAETSTFSFRPTAKGLIWADDEGLWMRDSSGKPVLGIYGGETYKSSWGGFDLYPGDLLIGNNAVGSSAIWWDQSAGKFGFYGAGSGTPQVEIATDGSLKAGAGKVVLDSTGITAYNAASTGAVYITGTGISTGDGGDRATIASWTSGGRIKWDVTGEIYAATPETYLDDSSINRTLYPLVIRAIRQGNDAALVEIAAVKSSDGTGAKIVVGEGFRLKDYFGIPYSANRVVHAMADSVILEVPSTTRFTLDSTGIKLAGMTVNTTQSTGVGALKMAGGTNRNNAGFLQASINGTTVYIPYWTTVTG